MQLLWGSSGPGFLAIHHFTYLSLQVCGWLASGCVACGGQGRGRTVDLPIFIKPKNSSMRVITVLPAVKRVLFLAAVDVIRSDSTLQGLERSHRIPVPRRRGDVED